MEYFGRGRIDRSDAVESASINLLYSVYDLSDLNYIEFCTLDFDFDIVASEKGNCLLLLEYYESWFS